MSAVLLRGAGYRYPGAAEQAVRGVDLRVEPGELLLLTGPTGCGKSTLLRLAAGLLARHGSGERTGEVIVAGADPAAVQAAERARTVGFVSQVPDRQIVTGTQGDEVAFALESAGWAAADIEARVGELLARFGLPTDPERSPEALSGGQRQRLVVAGAVAARPPVLLLDEPLAHLDPGAAEHLVALLRSLAGDGAAVVVVEHRLDALLDVADRVAVMEGGELRAVTSAGEVDLGLLRRLGLAVPGMRDLRDRLSDRPEPLRRTAAQDGGSAEDRGGGPDGAATQDGGGPHPSDASILLRAGPLTWRYAPGPPALDAVHLTLRAGERVALIGANGSGKSTLLRALVQELAAGPVDGRALDVPQDPDLALFCPSVRQELAYGPREQRLLPAQIQERIQRAAAALSIAELLDRPPHALSRGQRLRVAVAAALTCEPAVLLLDEPTAGQDRQQVEAMLTGATSPDRALVFATHDLELALRFADRLIWLQDGAIHHQGPPSRILPLLPATGPLRAPPLAAWCAAQGLPPLTVDELVVAP